MVTASFLKQIFKTKKKLLKASSVKICNPPHYDEISVTQLYPSCIKLPGMAEYFPDKYPKGRSCSREYFFSILATLHPEYTADLILNSKKVRFDGEDDEAVKEKIEIDPQWEEELKKFPQFASKCSIYILLLTYPISQEPKDEWCIYSRRRAKCNGTSRAERNTKL